MSWRSRNRSQWWKTLKRTTNNSLISKMMGRSNGANLLDVMAAVNQMKPSPLVNAERPHNQVRDAASASEKSLRLIEEPLKASQMFA